MDELLAKDIIKRFGADAHGLLECQKILKAKGLCHDTLAQCESQTYEMPSASSRQEFEAYLEYQLATAQTYNGQTISALAPSHYADLNDGACYKDARVEVEAFT
jgi:hypothetical protein